MNWQKWGKGPRHLSQLCMRVLTCCVITASYNIHHVCMYVGRLTNFETCPFVNTCDIFYGLPTGAHGATDVTGFGLLGHAQNLASAQKASVSFRIHTLPGTYKNMPIHCTCTFGQLSTNFCGYYF